MIKEENVDPNTVKEFLLQKIDPVGKSFECSVGSYLYGEAHFCELLSYLSDEDRKKVLTELLQENPKEFFSKIKVVYIKEIYDALSLTDYQELFEILTKNNQASEEEIRLLETTRKKISKIEETLQLEQIENTRKLEEEKNIDGKLNILKKQYNSCRYKFEEILGTENLFKECATYGCRKLIKNCTYGQKDLMSYFLDPKYNHKTQIKIFINYLTTDSKLEILKHEVLFEILVNQEEDIIKFMLSDLSLKDITNILNTETLDYFGGEYIFKFRKLSDLDKGYTKGISVIESIEMKLQEDEIYKAEDSITDSYETSSQKPCL